MALDHWVHLAVGGDLDGRQQGREPFGVQVVQHHLVALGLYCGGRGVGDGVVQAGRVGVGQDNEHLHGMDLA